MYKEALKLIKNAEVLPVNAWTYGSGQTPDIIKMTANARNNGIQPYFDSGKDGALNSIAAGRQSLKQIKEQFNNGVSNEDLINKYKRDAQLHDINLKRRYQNKQIDWPYVYFGRNDRTKGLNWYTKPVGTDQQQLKNWNKSNKPRSQQNWWQRMWN